MISALSGSSIRRRLMTGILAIAVFAVAVLSLCSGSFPVSATELFSALSGQETGAAARIILNLRLPRMILALLSGAALGLSGAILQSVLRNILASPDILGISAGGGVAGLALLLLFPGSALWLGPVTFAGAFGAAVLIYFAAWKRGIDAGRLILAGVALCALCGSISGTLLLLWSDRLTGIFDFTLGGFSGCSWPELRKFLPPFLLCCAGSAWLAKQLDILQLGDECAASLGMRVETVRLIALLTAALGAAAVASVAGLLGFAGLISPHVVRKLGRSGDHRFLLPASALTGALLVLTGDWLGRIIPPPPQELPAGVFLSAAGALFFLFLLLKERGENGR